MCTYHRCRIAHLLFFLGVITLAQNGIQGEQHPASADEGPLSQVQTAVGVEAALPCDLMPGTMIADKVQLVIWYREGNVKPIYTLDARGRPLNQAIPWADEKLFKKKAHFYYDTNPPALRIKNVQTSDAGLYKCRVDFHKSPTRNWRINVTVLVPPSQLTILDHNGAAVRDQMAGPYLEGDSINFTCLSSGGSPPPRVSWWREHALVDDSFHVLPDGTVRNVLQLKNIGRADLLTVYTCQATNGLVVPPLTKKVMLDMNLPPLSLLLQGLNHAVVAGTRTHVTCTAVGARPSPQIAWSKAGQILKGATQSTSSDGNTTVSELILIPVPEDNERQVVCSISLNAGVTSNQLQEGHKTIMTSMSNGNAMLYLKDSRVLNVTHAPIVSLSLGAPLDPNNLMKGSDVYLECDVKANPGITRVEWYHNDKQLHSSRGIIIANQTLVLQGIPKSSHGQYFCRATNIQGSVSSNEVYLDVKYPPVCKSDSTIIRAALRQTINITCQVDANPLDNLNYKWHFNNSLESLVELPATASIVSLSSSGGGASGGHGNTYAASATMPLLLHPDTRHTSGGYYQRSKRKHGHTLGSVGNDNAPDGRFVVGRHGRMAGVVASESASASASASGWTQFHFEDEDEDVEYGVGNEHQHGHEEQVEDNVDEEENDARNVNEGNVAYSEIDDVDDGGDGDEMLPPQPPFTQMVYSNMIYKNHVEGKQQQQQVHQQQQQQQHQHQHQHQHQQQRISGKPHQTSQSSSTFSMGGMGHSDTVNFNGGSSNSANNAASIATYSNQMQLAERKRLAVLHKQQHHRGTHNMAAATTTATTALPAATLNNVYSYHVDSYDSFGAISCVASSPMGQSQPCWYHIQPADPPDPIKNCTSYNATANSLQIQCTPGYDGGIPQHYHVQIFDELNRQILYNTSFKYSEFTVKRLPSDSVFVIRVTAVNAQGPSKVAFRLRGRTLSAPLLRTASSTAVLVQLTPLLGALVGVIATLLLVAICIVIFIKFRTKRTRRPAGDATTTEADKGSAEPLSRNMGSHSSLEDKNPDVVPQEANSEDEFHLEEKAFDRLNLDSQRILYTPSSRLNAASPPPPSLSPTFGKQYGELSLTTNPAFNLYNTPQRAPALQRPVYTAPPPLLSTRTPPNIYTRIPGRSYLPAAFETRTSPTSPYGSTTTCTLPLLGQSNASLQTSNGSGNGNGIGFGGGISACHTLPHPGSSAAAAAQQQFSMGNANGIPTALTSSMTSGNITISAAQSMLTSPRSAVYGNPTVQSPLLAATSALLGTGNYETVAS